MEDALRAEQLFAKGGAEALDELLDLATEFWDRSGPTGSGAAEVARLARVAAYLRKPAEDGTWQARAVEAACMTGAWRSLALSLRQYADRLVGSGDFEGAESVLHAMEALAQLQREGLPEPALVEGILAERRAVLFAERQDWSKAAEWFSKALDANPSHGRRELKVRGGMVRAEWLAGGPSDEAVRGFRELVEASAAWTDVHGWAVENLEAAQADDRSRSVPFDIT